MSLCIGGVILNYRAKDCSLPLLPNKKLVDSEYSQETIPPTQKPAFTLEDHYTYFLQANIV